MVGDSSIPVPTIHISGPGTHDNVATAQGLVLPSDTTATTAGGDSLPPSAQVTQVPSSPEDTVAARADKTQSAFKAKSSSTWYAALKNALAAVERATDAIPQLKSVVAAVNVLLETKDVSPIQTLLRWRAPCVHSYPGFPRPPSGVRKAREEGSIATRYRALLPCRCAARTQGPSKWPRAVSGPPLCKHKC